MSNCHPRPLIVTRGVQEVHLLPVRLELHYPVRHDEGLDGVLIGESAAQSHTDCQLFYAVIEPLWLVLQIEGVGRVQAAVLTG